MSNEGHGKGVGSGRLKLPDGEIFNLFTIWCMTNTLVKLLHTSVTQTYLTIWTQLSIDVAVIWPINLTPRSHKSIQYFTHFLCTHIEIWHLEVLHQTNNTSYAITMIRLTWLCFADDYFSQNASFSALCHYPIKQESMSRSGCKRTMLQLFLTLLLHNLVRSDVTIPSGIFCLPYQLTLFLGK